MNDINLTEILKFALPAVILLITVLVATSMVLKHHSLMNRVWQLAGIRKVNLEKTLLLRLQAYERLVLLTERINPSQLLLRVNRPDISAAELNGMLIKEIRTEFEYNLTQQLYISSACWQLISRLKEETIALVNNAAGELPAEATGTDLARSVLERTAAAEPDPYQEALQVIKAEAESATGNR